MTSHGPYGPFLPIGRRGPAVAMATLLGLTAAGVGAVLLLTRPGCDPGRFGPGSGDGRDPARPLLVHTSDALAEVVSCPDRHLRQVADVVAPAPWVPVGGPAGPGTPFTGSYDGGGHRISGVRVFLPGSVDAGLFGVLEGEIRDVVLDDLDVEAAARVGAVAGRVTASGRVRDVAVLDARVAGVEDVGGVAGLVHPDATVVGTFAGRLDGGGASTSGTAEIGRIGLPVAPGTSVTD